MNVLLAAATAGEIQIVKDFLQEHNFCLNQHRFDIIITGIGGISTTYNLVKAINEKQPEYVIQGGIAGSFDTKIPIGATVCVAEEMIGDLGAEENNEFRDVFDLGLRKESDPPFSGKYLKNPFMVHQNVYGLPLVRSISINEITTRKDRIDFLQTKFNPQVESMEGAAFHYVCLCEKKPFMQIRAVSNYVGERNKANWNIGLAVKNLNNALIEVVRKMSKCDD